MKPAGRASKKVKEVGRNARRFEPSRIVTQPPVCPCLVKILNLFLECPATFVPVDLRETGMEGALNGARKEAYS